MAATGGERARPGVTQRARAGNSARWEPGARHRPGPSDRTGGALGAGFGPPAVAHVRRPRLHAVLGDHRHRVVLVTAPAGAGKTELARAWCAEHPPARYHDVTAGADLAPAATLVIDGVHAAGEPLLEHIAALAATPGGPRLIVAGRWIPAGLRAAIGPAAAELDRRALALTPQEISRYCARLADVPPETVRDIFAITGGWAAGVVLAAGALADVPGDGGPTLRGFLAGGAGLGEYVLDEVLAGLPAADRRAVRDTCLAGAVCADLFTALTGHADAAGLLDRLAADEVFATVTGDGWYAYPLLWRSALYALLTHEDPARARALHRAAAGWYAAHRRFDEALHHAAAAGDQAHAERLRRDHYATLAGAALTALPLPDRPAGPGPAAPGLATPGSPARGSATSEPATTGPTASERATSEPATSEPATSEPATSEPATSEPATSEPATSEPAALGPAALSPAASGSVQPSVGEPLGAFAREVREALRRDQPLHARALLGRWLPAARERGPVAHAGAVRYRAMTELQSGALDAAARHAEEVHRTLAGHGATGAVDAGWADVVLAAVHIQRDELDAAAERLDTLAVRLWHGDPALTGAEYLQLAMIDQQRGEVGAALRTTRRLLHDGLPVPPEVHRLHVELLLAAGYHADAQRHAGRYAGNLTRSAGRLVRVRLLLTRPPTADVVADGQRLLRPVAQRPDHPLLHRIEALLLLARLAARAGDAAHAANLRRQAHDLAAPARIVRPFLLEPSLQSPGPPPPPAASHRPLPPPTTHAPTQPATAQGPTLPRTPHAPTPPAAGQGPTPPGTPHGPTPRAAPPGQASPPTPHAPTPPGNPHGPMPPGARRGPAEPAAGAAAVPHDAASPDGAVAAAVDGGDGITRSELLVLRRLAGLFTVTEIAADLHVSANTVKTHLAHIYRKLGVHRRRDAVVRAHELGLL